MPTDSQFKEAFAVASVSKAYLARYYLRALERAKQGEVDPELVPNEDPEAVNLEHIIPQKMSQSWVHITDDEHSALVHRIGNLALLKMRINSGAGADGFKYKSAFYRESALQLTRDIGSEAEWGRAQVEARQRRLADLAVKAWPLV